MSNSDTMRRRRISVTVRLIGAIFIVLLLMRSDWLAAVFLSGQGDKTSHSRIIDKFVNNNGKHVQQNILRQYLEKTEEPECSIPHLKRTIDDDDDDENDDENGSNIRQCRRIKPLKTSCPLAKQLFCDPLKLDIINSCTHRNDRTYCKVEGSAGAWKVKCDVTTCDQTWLLQTMDVHTGVKKQFKHESIIELQNHIDSFISNENIGFCMIVCGDKKGTNGSQGTSNKQQQPQILTLPSTLNDHSKVSGTEFININMVFIDSVSRHHFYRSLPRSVKQLEDIASRKNILLLDFEKVQGVRSRTYETLQTLFSGNINPFEIPFGTQEMPSKKLPVKELFQPLKNIGYSTLWLEDLCPYWMWGLPKDLLVYNSTLDKINLHKKFMSAIKESGIDSIGNTFASCDILNATGKPDPFHGPDKVCYNGQHHHDYLLDYLKMYIQHKTFKSQPYLSFFETNVGHEGNGIRIQYFDIALKNYLQFVSDLHNTITVIFSDHGNAYGRYVSETNEARLEMYHPFLFMIVPKSVQNLFTHHELKSLKRNQHRLISVLDLHYTLSYVTHKMYSINRNLGSHSTFHNKVSDFNHQFNVSKEGLFAAVSPERTCSQIPRVMPNLCICEGYDTAVSGNQGYHEILAMYFIGTLNNEILNQRHKHYNTNSKHHGGFGRCKQYRMDSIKNIQESRINDNEMIAKMDLYAKTTGQTNDEIYFVSVNVKLKSDLPVSLGSFERITPYSQYSTCSDEGVEAKLCVCNVNGDDDSNIEMRNINSMDYIVDGVDYFEMGYWMYNDFHPKVKSYTVDKTECLFIVSHSNDYGTVFEGHNKCKETVRLKIKLKPRNILLTSMEDFEVTLYPMDIRFLTAGVTNGRGEWSCDMNMHIKLL
ncbi:hypothetical protein ACF0H5_010442 [Mactra antiquata]